MLSLCVCADADLFAVFGNKVSGFGEGGVVVLADGAYCAEVAGGVLDGDRYFHELILLGLA